MKRNCIHWYFPNCLLPRTTPAGAIRQGDYKLFEFFEDVKTELYNLGKDTGKNASFRGDAHTPMLCQPARLAPDLDYDSLSNLARLVADSFDRRSQD